jgi:hypothetical protein
VVFGGLYVRDRARGGYKIERLRSLDPDVGVDS